MGSYTEHQELLKRTINETQKLYPQILFFPQFSGLLKAAFGYIKIGQDGIADIFFAYPVKEQLLFGAAEVKTGFAKLSKNQISFKNVIEKRNGLYILVRNDVDIINALKRRYGGEYV